MTDWEEQIREGLAEFRKQGADGTACEVTVIYRRNFDAMVAAARKGERDAQAAVAAINQWAKLCDAATGGGGVPGCISCEAAIERGDICGFVIVGSIEPGKDAGLTGAFCAACEQRGTDAIVAGAIEAIRREFGEVTLAQ